MLLDLDLVPLNTDASVGDRESLLLIASLDLDLHDTLLEECNMKIEVGCTVLKSIGEILMLMQVESSVDSVLMDNEAIWLNIVSSHEMVLPWHAIIPFLTTVVILMIAMTLILVMVTSKKGAEAVAEVLLTAHLVVLLVELVVAMVSIADVLRVLSVVIVTKCIISVVCGNITIDVVLAGMLIRIVDILSVNVLISVVVGSVVLSLENGLESEFVGGESLTSGLGLKAKNTCGKNLCGEIHLLKLLKEIKFFNYYNLLIIYLRTLIVLLGHPRLTSRIPLN